MNHRRFCAKKRGDKMSNSTLSARQFNRLVEAALKWEEGARYALKEAIKDAHLGQNGSVFITDNMGMGRRTLYINSRKRAMVVDWVYNHRMPMQVYSAEYAEEDFRERKASNVAAYKRRMAARDDLIRDLLYADHTELSSFFGSWDYETGQCGGVFVNSEGVAIAAEKALVAAHGPDWEDLPTAYCLQFEKSWDRKLYGARF